MKLRKKLFIGIIVAIVLIWATGCDDSEPKAKEDSFVKEITVKPITVEEIQVETILYENIETETILYEDVTTYWD